MPTHIIVFCAACFLGLDREKRRGVPRRRKCRTFPRGLSLAKKSASAIASSTNCRRQCRASALSLLISHSSTPLPPPPTRVTPLEEELVLWKAGGPSETLARLLLLPPPFSTESSSHQRVLARMPSWA